MLFFTLTFIGYEGDERDELGEDAPPNHGAGNEAGVVSRILSFHLGDVKVPRLLGDEAPAISVQEDGELVEDPAVGDLLCRAKDKHEQDGLLAKRPVERLFYAPGHALGGAHSRTAPCPSLTRTGSLSS